MNFESLYNPVDGKIEDAPEDFENLPSASDGFFVPAKPEPSLFDGMSETWKAPISGAIKTTAAFETALAETNVVGSALQMHETETGEAIANLEEREKQIAARLEQEASEHRELAQKEYGLDPETSGFAAQMVFGLAETLPKAIGYSILGGPIGGAVGFGADVGLTTYGELRDKGVDKGTAAVAGLTSGAFNAVGVWLPATFGKSRAASATIGALANFGLTGAELAGVSFALATQDYDDLAEQYGLNWTALATSAVFGGAFGGAMYRAPKLNAVNLRDSIYTQLKETGGVYANDEVASKNADLHTLGIMSFVRRGLLSEQEAMEMAPKIVGVVEAARSKDAIDMVTFDYEWVYGDKAAREADKTLEVAPFTSESSRIVGNVNFNSLQKFLKQYVTTVEKKRGGEYNLVSKGPPLVNRETGWTLTVSNSDAGEIAHKLIDKAGKSKEILKASLVAVSNLQKVVELGYLAESYRDVKAFYRAKKEDADLIGLHRFYTPMLVDGELFAVKMTVKDRSKIKRTKVNDIGDVPRTALYSVESLEIKKLSPGETATVSEGRYIDGDHLSMVDDGGTASVSIAGGDNAAPTLSILQRARTTHEISVREMLTGVNRDGDAKYVKNKEDKYEKVVRSRFFDGAPGEDAFGYRNDPDDSQWQKLQRGESLNALGQKADGVIAGQFVPGANEIKLTPNANLSTFSHEMGHWYLDTMFKLSGRGSADLNADINILLREFGIKSVDDWNALGVEGQRKYHEQFASWLEVYLSKGEAPKPELKSLFERVAQWIVDVYESFGGTKKAVEGRYESEFGTKLPEMSDEVKAVMDRLFAENKANEEASKMKATPDQVAASRVVLDDFVHNERLGRLIEKVGKGKKLTKEERDYWNASLRAMRIAEQGLNEGKPVDVSAELRDVPLDEKAVTEAQGKLEGELGDIKPKQREAQAEVEQVVVSETDRVIKNVEDTLVQIKDADGSPLLDADAVHEGLSVVKLAIDAVNDARALNERLTAQTNTLEAKRESARAVLSEDGQQAMLHNIGEEMPGQTYRIQDANGNVVDMTIADIEAEQARLLEQAKTDQAAMGKAIECILNNQGI